MASRSTRKTWETAFLLSASMSSSYQETFDRAQEILKTLGAENVNLGDEAERAAQRQENAFMLAAAAITESGLTEALGTIKDAYAEIIQVTSEFEYTMSAVEAIASASADEVAALEAKARELGETTVFTAQQSAEAMTFMAQAGWDTTEMLEGMSGVISLAAASGTDLAETSSIVADTLAGFGMAADETGRLADVLAQTASHTNTNVSLLGETFSNAAAVAGALGFEVEDVSVMLGLMANAGVKGSRAGTTLRNIFNGLAKDVTLTAEAFGEVDFSMFDEAGNSKNLTDVVRELRGYFDEMTDKEKYLNASALAGMRGYNGLLAIIGATDEEFEQLYADIQNADGAAKRMADTRLDNLKGDVTLLNSAFESLKITVGEEFTPAGRSFIQWLTGVTQGINDFTSAHPEVIRGIAEIIALIGAATVALKATAGVMKAIAGLKILMDLMGGAPLIAAGIGAAIAAIGIAVVKLREARSEVQKLEDEHKRITKEYEEATAALDEQYEGIQNYLTILDTLSSKENRSESDKQKLLAVVNKLNEAVPELGIEYDIYADKLNMSAEAVKNLARAEYLRKTQNERMERMEELAGLSIEQESAMLDLQSQLGEQRLVLDEIQRNMDELEANKTVWDDMNPFSEYNRKRNQLINETAKPLMMSDRLEREIQKLSEEQKKTDEEYNSLANEYVQKQNQFDYFWNRTMGDGAEGSEDLKDEAAGQEAISEARKEVEGAGYELNAADLRAAANGTYVSSEDVSDQYDGAAVTENGGDVSVTMNINVDGNVTEGAMEEMEAVVSEAADRVVAFFKTAERNHTRSVYQ